MEKAKFNFAKLLPDVDNVKLIFFMAVVFVLMTAFNPGKFLSPGNFLSMSFQFPELGIISVGMMMAMLTGGIDLSMVGIANLSSVVAGMLMASGVFGSDFFGVLVSILVAMLIGGVCGIFNGFCISKIGIPPILVTLGSMQIFTGIAVVVTEGTAVLGFPAVFSEVGNGSLFGFIPYPLLIFVVIAIIFTVVLNRSGFGYKIYMMGSNPTASKFSGLKNDTIIIKTYALVGVLASIAGIVLISRTNSAKADYGSSYILQAIIVSVMGGVDPKGGFGTISGVILSLITLQFLSSGLNMMDISNFFKDFIWGITLILVMIVNYYLRTTGLAQKLRDLKA